MNDATMVAYSDTYVTTQVANGIKSLHDFLNALEHAAQSLNDGLWLLVTRNNTDGTEPFERITINVRRP